MIIQQQAADGTCFAIRNTDHARFAGQLARYFGNADFTLAVPEAELFYLVDHHDEGWREIDNAPALHADTGLPCNLVETPSEYLICSGKASPDFNERYSPLCGMVSSMHTYGLYHDRYGLSDGPVAGDPPARWQAAQQEMLQGEERRQQRLRTRVDDDLAFYLYKLLQFFDTCALYFNFRPAGVRGCTTFNNVPRDMAADTEITVSESQGVYLFDPWPFSEATLELACPGRYFRPADITPERPFNNCAGYTDRQPVVLRPITH